MMTLSAKQARFVDEYLIDANATQAAIRAGYSERSAVQTASRLMTNDNIRDAIGEVQKSRSERTKISADKVVQELARIAFANVCDMFDSNWDLLPIDQIPKDLRPAISKSKKVTREDKNGNFTTTQEVLLYDKVAALNMLAKHLGMYSNLYTDSPRHDFDKMTTAELDKYLADMLSKMRVGAA